MTRREINEDMKCLDDSTRNAGSYGDMQCIVDALVVARDETLPTSHSHRQTTYAKALRTNRGDCSSVIVGGCCKRNVSTMEAGMVSSLLSVWSTRLHLLPTARSKKSQTLPCSHARLAVWVCLIPQLKQRDAYQKHLMGLVNDRLLDPGVRLSRVNNQHIRRSSSLRSFQT